MPVETLISERSLHGSVQAGFLHTAPTLGVLRQTRCRDRQAQTAAQGRENLSEVNLFVHRTRGSKSVEIQQAQTGDAILADVRRPHSKPMEGRRRPMRWRTIDN